MAQRERISPFIRKIRDFLAGRQLPQMQRYKDLIAPRSIPAANLPKGPHDRYFKNSYFERDGRRLVVPPKVTFQNPELAPPGTKLPGTVPIAQLTGSGEVPKESRSSIVTPGLVYRWD